jgi:HAD superfamily hydrolase (TIGR01662 family)
MNGPGETEETGKTEETGGTIRAVVFDVGETLVDETRAWGEWADWLGVPRLTLLAVLGGVIERGEDHRRAFEIVRPGIDLAAEVSRQRAAGRRYRMDRRDLYPDALPALKALHERGFRLGVAANQPIETEQMIAALGVPLDLVATSAGWGLVKPEPAFFERVIAELDLPAAEIAYVGDRIDNDVRPAAAAGMRAIFIRRGPWALLQARDGPPPEAAATIDSLLELPEVLAALGRA